MPVVNVQITKDGATAEQKARLVAEITATLQNVLGKRPEHTHVIIQEIEPKNWGYAGVLTTVYRQQQRHPAAAAPPGGSTNLTPDTSPPPA